MEWSKIWVRPEYLRVHVVGEDLDIWTAPDPADLLFLVLLGAALADEEVLEGRELLAEVVDDELVARALHHLLDLEVEGLALARRVGVRRHLQEVLVGLPARLLISFRSTRNAILKFPDSKFEPNLSIWCFTLSCLKLYSRVERTT